MQKSIQMPQILQKGCVLQRGNATRIWGWYKKGIKIEISFQNKQYMTETDENGMFEALIACKSGRGPFTLEVRSEDGQEVEISEVYVGDVSYAQDNPIWNYRYPECGRCFQRKRVCWMYITIRWKKRRSLVRL